MSQSSDSGSLGSFGAELERELAADAGAGSEPSAAKRLRVSPPDATPLPADAEAPGSEAVAGAARVRAEAERS